VRPYKVILWDVYGTLMRSRAGDLQALTQRGAELLGAFEKVVAHFDLEDAIGNFAPDKRPAEELRQLYLSRIDEVHRRKIAQGIEHPEVRIDEIWIGIIESLAEHGYRRPEMKPGSVDFAREVALFFERTANPKALYPGVWETLLELHRRKKRQGIVSNAQFYTHVELGELLRIESNGDIPTLHTIFEDLLTFLSCDFGFAKPNPAIFEQVRKVIWAEGLRVKECLCVGNDMLTDVWCAKQCGFDAALFAGDPDSVRWRRDDPRCAELKPEAVFRHHAELFQLV